MRLLAVFNGCEEHCRSVSVIEVGTEVALQIYDEPEVGDVLGFLLIALLDCLAVRTHHIDERDWGDLCEGADGRFEFGGVGVVLGF